MEEFQIFGVLSFDAVSTEAPSAENAAKVMALSCPARWALTDVPATHPYTKRYVSEPRALRGEVTAQQRSVARWPHASIAGLEVSAAALSQHPFSDNSKCASVNADQHIVTEMDRAANNNSPEELNDTMQNTICAND